MTATKTREMPTSLRLYHGCGMAYDVPADKLEEVEGTALDALRKIAAEEIRDPELIRTLQDERLVIQAFSDEASDVHQRTISPAEDFSQLASNAHDKMLEMSVSVAHRGGDRHPNARNCGIEVRKESPTWQT